VSEFEVCLFRKRKRSAQSSDELPLENRVFCFFERNAKGVVYRGGFEVFTACAKVRVECLQEFRVSSCEFVDRLCPKKTIHETTRNNTKH
jgi:hypothetical protein